MVISSYANFTGEIANFDILHMEMTVKCLKNKETGK